MKEQNAQSVSTPVTEVMVQNVHIRKIKELNEFKLNLVSMVFAFVLIIIFIASGVYLTTTGHDTVGGIIFSTTIIGVGGMFITGAYNKTQAAGTGNEQQ